MLGKHNELLFVKKTVNVLFRILRQISFIFFYSRKRNIFIVGMYQNFLKWKVANFIKGLSYQLNDFLKLQHIIPIITSWKMDGMLKIKRDVRGEKKKTPTKHYRKPWSEIRIRDGIDQILSLYTDSASGIWHNFEAFWSVK